MTDRLCGFSQAFQLCCGMPFTGSEISKTAGTLDLALVWEDDLNDPVDFFTDGL